MVHTLAARKHATMTVVHYSENPLFQTSAIPPTLTLNLTLLTLNVFLMLTFGIVDPWNSGPSEQWTFGTADHWNTGPIVLLLLLSVSVSLAFFSTITPDFWDLSSKREPLGNNWSRLLHSDVFTIGPIEPCAPPLLG